MSDISTAEGYKEKFISIMDFAIVVYPVAFLSNLIVALHVFMHLKGVVGAKNCATIDPIHLVGLIMDFIVRPLDYTQPLVPQIVLQVLIVFFYRSLLYKNYKSALSANVLAIKIFMEIIGFVITTPS